MLSSVVREILCMYVLCTYRDWFLILLNPHSSRPPKLMAHEHSIPGASWCSSCAWSNFTLGGGHWEMVGGLKDLGFYPPNHPLKNRVFHYKPSILGFFPLFLETPIWYISNWFSSTIPTVPCDRNELSLLISWGDSIQHCSIRHSACRKQWHTIEAGGPLKTKMDGTRVSYPFLLVPLFCIFLLVASLVPCPTHGLFLGYLRWNLLWNAQLRLERWLFRNFHVFLLGNGAIYFHDSWFMVHTLPETNGLPLQIGHPKRKLAFQPSIFRCELLVSWCISFCFCIHTFSTPSTHFLDRQDRKKGNFQLRCPHLHSRQWNSDPLTKNRFPWLCLPKKRCWTVEVQYLERGSSFSFSCLPRFFEHPALSFPMSGLVVGKFLPVRCRYGRG